MRKHEAIETDIVAYSGRVQAVDAVAAELAAERYHDIKRIAARQHNVARLWDFLRQMVAARRERLLLNLELQKVFQDLLYLMDWMEEMKVSTDAAVGQRCSGPFGGWAAMCRFPQLLSQVFAECAPVRGPVLGSDGQSRRLPVLMGLTFQGEETDDKTLGPSINNIAAGRETYEKNGSRPCDGVVQEGLPEKCHLN